MVNVVDDARTPEDPTEDFQPVCVTGDTNGDAILDTGEIWIYISIGVVDYKVTDGLYTNTATVTGVVPDTESTVTDWDSNSHQ